MANPNKISLKIKFDWYLCDEFLKLAAPEKIPAEWPHWPSSFMDVNKESTRYCRFREKVLRHLDTLHDDFKLGGILNNEEALGQIVWIGQLIKPSGITMYPFPDKYPVFRRCLLRMAKGVRAAVRIRFDDDYMEKTCHPPRTPSLSSASQTDDHLCSTDSETDERPHSSEADTPPRSNGDSPTADHSDVRSPNEPLNNPSISPPAKPGVEEGLSDVQSPNKPLENISISPPAEPRVEENTLTVDHNDIPLAKRQRLHQMESL
ncbi:hypothetical protein PTTG_11382 [Puccinia triticina 1-1 BBBD Race 1]|uniref:Uncharacterized protein n=2 Tax=Puccinia triticina (isolate 1-1 / race 1 (BBBD)) TaxID=630390 RepID=A0A180G2J5_PUCT1|nr:hypothetical protein PTTG_11382 [Puccinia triticina 1-1 BBBD Race 1]WAR51734.1 hypothetical protein PtB15_1B170 [Puccinia triticina]